MTGNVVSIQGGDHPRMGAPVQKLIDALTDALQMAKDGRLQSFVGAGFTADNCRLVIMLGEHHENVHEMLGSIAWLQHEYVHRKTGDD